MAGPFLAHSIDGAVELEAPSVSDAISAVLYGDWSDESAIPVSDSSGVYIAQVIPLAAEIRRALRGVDWLRSPRDPGDVCDDILRDVGRAHRGRVDDLRWAEIADDALLDAEAMASMPLIMRSVRERTV